MKEIIMATTAYDYIMANTTLSASELVNLQDAIAEVYEDIELLEDVTYHSEGEVDGVRETYGFWTEDCNHLSVDIKGTPWGDAPAVILVSFN